MKVSERAKVRIRLIYSIVLSVLLAVCGVSFIAGCCGINALGDDPFTYESIRAAFSAISVPVYITVFAVVLGFVLFIVFPTPGGKLRPVSDSKVQLKRARVGRSLKDAPSDTALKITKEIRLRTVLYLTQVLLLVVGSVVALVYSFTESNFTEDYNSSVLRGAIVTAASLVPAAFLAILRVFLDDGSRGREIALLKTLPKGQGEGKVPSGCPVFATFSSDSRAVTLGIRITVGVLAVVFIALGIFNGGMNDVLQKAIKICTECIGLG